MRIRKEFFKTLFSRMLATYLTVILCLLLLMGVTVSNMFKNQYMEEQENTLREEAAEINTILVEKYVDENKRFVANDELEISARKFDAWIVFIDSRGGVKSIHNATAASDKWRLLPETIKQYPDENPVRVSLPGLDVYPSINSVAKTNARRFLSADSTKTLITEQGAFYKDLLVNVQDISTLTFVRAVVYNEKYDGIIVMHVDMHNVNTSITQVYMDVLLIGLLAVLAAVLVVYYLTTRITKPITDMNAIVRRYSKGSFDLRLHDEGADEVAQLAKSFNVMAAELSALETTRRSFVANVSHELRSPLTSISGFLEAIQDGTIPPEKQSAYIDIVIGETKRMTSMVNDLLDLARIESGQVTLQLSQFDINELVRRTVLTFEARINASQLEVVLLLAEPHCYVEADADKIAQVLRNLIDNAVKYSPQNGRLIIKTELAGRHSVHVCVHDFGSGIPQEDVPHVFTRFYKVEKAHTPSAKSGTGLGLSIAKVIIDQHGQDIWAQSAVGQGTVFIFTLKHVADTRRRAENDKRSDE